MKTNKNFLKSGRGLYLSVLALFLLSATFFPAIEALASPTGFEVLQAEFEVVDGEAQLNITLERTRQTAEDIIGTLRFPEDYTEENLTLVDLVQPWGTMTRNQIKYRVYKTLGLGTLTYPNTLLLDLIYTVRGRQQNETLLLDITWPWESEVHTQAISPYITIFDATDPDKGSASIFKTWIYNPGRFPETLGNIQFQFSSSTYDDFTFTTPLYSRSDNLPGEESTTRVDHGSGPWVKQDGSSTYRYALNNGSYEINNVYVKGKYNPWYDNYNPGNDGKFDVLNGTTHKVFVAAIVFDDIPTSTPTDHFDEIETHDLNVSQSSSWVTTDFATKFSTDFMVSVYASAADTSGVVNWSTAWDLMRYEAKNILSLNSNWT